ncbi:AlpA family phage regulatory protein [Ramlibacter sp. XY19]|uniref:helix-turn-helix transcriptional regulator n=1 Tax=Ramlibacter paludis TaxID=2908000 RepID=UPI0023DA1FB3|nr:AlpA family phage regulatory protein [Ramlibacter paludis]MCG2592143.1 AlpA family phage regulatory protein [Ramlibacter paludis]
MNNQHTSTPAGSSQRLVIRRTELPALLGLSLPTIDRLRAQGRFPVPRRLGQQAIGFLLADIEEWLATRPTVAH